MAKSNFTCTEVTPMVDFPNLRTAKFTPSSVGCKDKAKLDVFFASTPPGAINVSGVADGQYQVGQMYSADITIE